MRAKEKKNLQTELFVKYLLKTPKAAKSCRDLYLAESTLKTHRNVYSLEIVVVVFWWLLLFFKVNNIPKKAVGILGCNT